MYSALFGINGNCKKQKEKVVANIHNTARQYKIEKSEYGCYTGNLINHILTYSIIMNVLIDSILMH
jgi:hypothetical protein